MGRIAYDKQAQVTQRGPRQLPCTCIAAFDNAIIPISWYNHSTRDQITNRRPGTVQTRGVLANSLQALRHGTHSLSKIQHVE